MAYLATFQEYDSFVLMNLGFTLLMMLYDVIAKVLRWVHVTAQPAHPGSTHLADLPVLVSPALRPQVRLRARP